MYRELNLEIYYAPPVATQLFTIYFTNRRLHTLKFICFLDVEVDVRYKSFSTNFSYTIILRVVRKYCTPTTSWLHVRWWASLQI